jgi:hypothetical protein
LFYILLLGLGLGAVDTGFMKTEACFRAYRTLLFIAKALHVARVASRTLLAFALVAANSSCWAASPEEYPKELLALRKQLAGIPDWQIAFRTMSQHGPNGVRHRTHRYVKKGACWRHESFETSGQMFFRVSFDGEKYYVYRPTANYLYVGHDPGPIARDIKRAHCDNPFFIWALPFFVSSPVHYKLPDLGEEAVWIGGFGKQSVLRMNSEGSLKPRFMVYSQPYDFEILLEAKKEGMMEVSEILIKHRGPFVLNMLTKVTYEDWRYIPSNGSTVSFPMRISGETRMANGQRVAMTRFRSEVIPESIAPAGEDLEPAFFRVPLKKVARPIVVPKSTNP